MNRTGREGKAVPMGVPGEPAAPAAPTGRAAVPSGCSTAASAALLVLLVALVYGRTAGNGFVDFDDPEFIRDNPAVRSGLMPAAIGWAFTTFQLGNWHPLTWLSHLLDISLFGMSPGAHHAVSAALHGVAAVLLFLALRSATGSSGRSLFVAAVFAAHPLNVESVAWIAERKSVLCAVFWMLTLLAWTRHLRRPGAARSLAVAGCLALALLAKPMAVVIPFLLLLLDFWPFGRIGPRAAWSGREALTLRVALAEKAPLFALALAVAAVTVVAQSEAGALQGFERYPLAARLGNAALSAAIYPLKALWPSGLAVYHPHPGPRLHAWQWAASMALVLAATLAAAALLRRRPALSAGWLWYLLSLAPVSGIVQVGGQGWAERYAYFPLIGLALAVAWGPRSAGGRSAAGRARAALASVAVAVFALAAAAQAGRWRDSETLFRHALAVTEGNVLVHTNLGVVYFRQGRLEDALAEFEAALRVQPANTKVLFNSGLTLARLRRRQEAAEAFERIIELEPGRCDARYELGYLSLFRGDRETAMEQQRALEKLCPEEARRLAAYLGVRM